MISVNQSLQNDLAQWRLVPKEAMHDLRVACPGIVSSFDADEQTVSVKLALRELILTPKKEHNMIIPRPEWVEVIELQKVPICIPRAGGFSLTLPVSVGDECLVVFADACYDAWWQSGDVQNQIDKRRHDLWDGFAIIGPWSQPRKLADYSTTAAQLRSDDGSVKVEVSGNAVNITAPTVTISGDVTIEGKSFLGHTHSGVQSGSSATGGVV